MKDEVKTNNQHSDNSSPTEWSSAAKTMVVLLSTILIAILGGSLSRYAKDGDVITLHGASQFDDSHSYTKALVRFTELVEKYYQGPRKVKFILHKNSELGLEKDYFGFMNIGAVVDFAVVAPSHASTFSSMVAIMDVPFLFRDTEHYLASLEADVFAPIAQRVQERADVMILGYGGGEKRHFVGSRPVRNMAELKNFYMRVMGAPIQSRMFSALGATPTVISFGEVYNAIQTGVIEGAENSASAISHFKWFEVAQDVSLSAVSIIVRPMFFSGKRFRRLPPDLQEVIRRAGREAMIFERNFEIETDDPLMQQLEAEGKIRTHPFEERDQLLELAAPVKAAFAEEIGAVSILNAINKIQ